MKIILMPFLLQLLRVVFVLLLRYDWMAGSEVTLTTLSTWKKRAETDAQRFVFKSCWCFFFLFTIKNVLAS